MRGANLLRAAIAGTQARRQAFPAGARLNLDQPARFVDGEHPVQARGIERCARANRLA
jgi:hypothetical protein